MRPGLIIMWLIQIAIAAALIGAMIYITFGLAGLR